MTVTPKLRLRRAELPRPHRSGWNYALDALTSLHKNDGVLVDTFLESTFAWHRRRERESGAIPYRSPWIGFLHNPPGIPRWHDYDSAPASVVASPEWKASIDTCAGIITLSHSLAAWVRRRTRVPVLSLIHPTEPATLKFTLEAFYANSRPLVMQVGLWLRRLTSIHQLRPRRLTPAILEPIPQDRTRILESMTAREMHARRLRIDVSAVNMVPFAANDEYDWLLSRNIVFLDLFDCAAVNVIVECIDRNTPVLVRDLPAAREYLGESYPFFFKHIYEARAKVNDAGQIRAAHEYLKEIPKEQFSADTFRESLMRSELYCAL